MSAADTVSHRLLIISHDRVGEHMAGPGIRYYHLARVLAQHLPTTLAAPAAPGEHKAQSQPFDWVHYDPANWSSLVTYLRTHTICLAPSAMVDQLALLPVQTPYIVVDGYDPLLAEWLALPKQMSVTEQLAMWHEQLVVNRSRYLIGDFYLCASERQRDWWLGQLEASGRINPATFQHDPSLRKLIDVVPYGLPSTPAQPTRSVVKGVWPGIEQSDKLLLWGGGLWPWLDPVTAIRAVALVRQTRQDVKLIFPGTRHPNPEVAGMPTATAEARQVAAELGLVDQAVFFGDWVSYADWPNVLLESDLALSLHFDTLETRLAFRSRVLDYIWVGLPIIATRGDATSELVEQHGLGAVVDYGDVEGLAVAIQMLLAEPAQARTEAFATARYALTWEKAAAPLVAYCREPWMATDRSFVESLEDDEPAVELAQLRQERDYWRDLTGAYERGRFIRFMKWVGHFLPRRRREHPPMRPATVSTSHLERPRMSDLQTISVIIPVRNGMPYLRNCLDALLAQQQAAPELKIQIVAVDNASIDGSADFIAQHYPMVRLICNKVNRGFAGGCNQGLAAAPAGIAILLNQDTRVYPGWVRAIVHAFADRTTGIVGCKIYYPDGKTLQHTGGHLRRPDLNGIHFSHGDADEGQGDQSRPVEWVTGAAFAIRRRVIDAIGYLDEGFWPGYYEDVDYCLRARAAGWQVWYCAEAVLEHQETSSRIDERAVQRFYHRGRLRLALKHLSPAEWWRDFLPYERSQAMRADAAVQSAYLDAVLAAPLLLKTHWHADDQEVRELVAALRELAQSEESRFTALPAPPPESLSTQRLVFNALGRLWYNVKVRVSPLQLQQQQDAVNWQHMQQLASLQHQIDQLELANAALTHQLAQVEATTAQANVAVTPRVEQ